MCRGDGETAVERGENGELVEIECPGQDCPWYEKKHCRHVMNLQFIIPQLISEGIFQIDTSSYHSIINFNSSWEYVRALTGGKISMIPLILRLVPKEVSPDGKKKIVHVLELKLAQRMGLADLQALAEGQAPRAELPPADESGETGYLYPKDARPKPPRPSGAAPDNVVLDESLEGDLEVAEEAAEGEVVSDELGNQIEDLCAALNLTPAQRELRWKKAGGDKQVMVDLLTEQYEKESNVKPLRRGRGQQNKNAAQAGERGQADQPRAASDDKKPTTSAASKKQGSKPMTFF